MQEQTSSTQTVSINQSKAYPDAFANPSMRLYIPVDKDGNLADVAEAVQLQCWLPGERNAQIPEATTMSAEGMTKSLLKAWGDSEFGSLSRSVAYGSLAKMEVWLRTLHRHESGDYNSFSIYYR